MHCPYEKNRHAPEDGAMAQCMVLSIACGFTVSNGGPLCEYCISGPAWNDADIVQLKPESKERSPSEADALKLVEQSPFFKSLYHDSLRARLISGDCPRYQGSNPVDVNAAFAKFQAAAGVVAAKDTLVEMFERQSMIAEADGGDSAEVLVGKITLLAEKHGM